MALEHLNKKSQNENFEETALTREKNMVTNALDRKDLFQEGFKKGFKEGFQEGFKKGFKKGFKEGREENQKDIILTMIERNYSLPEIAKIVKCPEDEIKKLMK